jgi:hypothetical protein
LELTAAFLGRAFLLAGLATTCTCAIYAVAVFIAPGSSFRASDWAHDAFAFTGCLVPLLKLVALLLFAFTAFVWTVALISAIDAVAVFIAPGGSFRALFWAHDALALASY